jgi:hypothetical protein
LHPDPSSYSSSHFSSTVFSFSPPPFTWRAQLCVRGPKGVFLKKHSAPRRWCVRWLVSYGNGTRRSGYVILWSSGRRPFRPHGPLNSQFLIPRTTNMNFFKRYKHLQNNDHKSSILLIWNALL